MYTDSLEVDYSCYSAVVVVESRSRSLMCCMMSAMAAGRKMTCVAPELSQLLHLLNVLYCTCRVCIDKSSM